MRLTWPRFFSELEARQGSEAVIQFECKGAFLKFRSKLIRVDRPSSLSLETMERFGVLPQHLTLRFANGVSVNVYTRHIEEVALENEAVIIAFRGEGASRTCVTLLPRAEQGFAG